MASYAGIYPKESTYQSSQDDLDSVVWALNTNLRVDSDLNAQPNSFYLIHFMPAITTIGLLHFIIKIELFLNY